MRYLGCFVCCTFGKGLTQASWLHTQTPAFAQLAIIAYFVDLLQQTRAITRLGITSLEQLKARMEDELTKPPAGLALPDVRT